MDERTKNLFNVLLVDPDPDARRRAAEDLAESKDRNAVTVLSLALQDENKGVEDAVYRSILSIGGPAAARAIVHYLASENIGVRNRAAKLLTKLGQASVHALISFLQDGDKDVRKLAVDILGEIKSKETLYYLLPLLKDTDPNVFVSTLEALGNIRGADAIKPIIEAFDKYPFARIVAIEALGKIGGNSARDYLETKLREALSAGTVDGVYLFALLDAIGVVGDRDTLGMLLKNYEAVQNPLRDVLLHEIVQITERCNLEYHFEEKVRGDLLHALHNDNHAIQLSAAKGLTQFKDELVTRDLLLSLGISEEMDCVVIAEMYARLRVFQIAIGCLEEGVSRGKIQVILVLGKLAAEFVRSFKECREYPVDENDVDQAFGLCAEAWQEAGQEDWETIAEVLLRLDCDRAAAFLQRAMTELDPLSRLHTIDQLAVMPTRRAIECVACFKDDENEMVREAVHSVLRSAGFPEETTVSMAGREPENQEGDEP
jgi:HEAT repeat protein